MPSKFLELTGFGLIAWGAGRLLGTAAALICAGLALLLVGGVTDDAAATAALRRGWDFARYRWQVLILRDQLLASSATESAGSLHPPLKVDPETQAFARRAARARTERAKLHDRTPALSRQATVDEDLERLA